MAFYVSSGRRFLFIYVGREVMSKITILDKQLMAEIIENPIAFRLLKDKSRWEGMTLYAVLQEWGDPREWSVYKEDANRDE